MEYRSRKLVRIKDESISFRDFKLFKPFRSYCRSKHVKPKDVPNTFLLIRIIADICKEIRHQMIEKRGGVMIKDFGYFCVHVSQGHNIFYKYSKDLGKMQQMKLSRDLGRKRITLMFLPVEKNAIWKLWSMNHQFEGTLKDAVKRKIREGFKYKIYPFTLRKMLGMSQFADTPIGRKKEEE